MQPEHIWGVEIDENTHYAIDIYDNAMYIALNNFIELTDDAAKKAHWTAACNTLKQNWTWFGARMIHALTENGMIAEAYEELQPMLERVVENNGFNEWYTPAGEPMGSGTFRGEAGVLYKANALLRAWAEAQPASASQ